MNINFINDACIKLVAIHINRYPRSSSVSKRLATPVLHALSLLVVVGYNVSLL